MLKSGTYGADGSEYQTETYSNLRIIARGTSQYGASYGPQFFEVLYPDGSKALYGASADSNSPFEYAITYSENALGVRIRYSYIQNNNVLRVSEIGYGSIGTTPPINKITFTYQQALRGEQVWVAGVSVYKNWLLAKISVTSEGVSYRNYKLIYNTGSLNYQQLASIQEINGLEDRSFPATEFSYSSTGDVIVTSRINNLSLTGIASNNSSVVTGDFTGNGTMDFILYPNSKDKIWAFYDLDAGSPHMQIGYEVNTGYFQKIFPVTWLSHNNKVLPGEGIAVVKKNSDSYQFQVLSSGTTAPVYLQYDKIWSDIPRGPTYYSECDYKYYPGNPLSLEFASGDFNGDGLTDVLAISSPVVTTLRRSAVYDDPFGAGSMYTC